MENARIIRLGDSVGTSNEPRIATFEEAFGEYSELFGKKARARREKRRDDRTAAKVRRQERKTERKVARQTRKDDVRASKQERRSNRKQRRQQMRIDRRAQRKATRQAMRADQQAARMARRMERKRQRQDRKDEVADREMERELRMAEGQQMLDQYAPQDDYGYEDDGYGYEDDGYGYEDDGYAPSGGGSYGGGGSYYEEDWGTDGYGDDTAYGWNDPYGDYEDYGDGDYNYEDDYGFDEYGYGDEYGDEFGGYGFDGEVGVEADGSEEAQEAQKIADKIEWNKKLISKMANDGNGANAINERNKRITALKCQMRDFVCFDGDYFDEYEDEEFVGADGIARKMPMKGAIKRRMAMANRAKGVARKKAGFGRGRGLAKGRTTMVKRGIGAEIENNRIVIPATSSYDGSVETTQINLSPTPSEAYYEATGITALDANDDFGYKPTEIQLGFDGKSNMGMSRGAQIALGLGVGIAAIAILKATKVL